MSSSVSVIDRPSRARKTLVFLGDENRNSIFDPIFEKVFSYLGIRADVIGLGSELVDVYLPVGEEPFRTFVQYISVHKDEYSQAIVLLPEMSMEESLYYLLVFFDTVVPLKIFTVSFDGDFSERAIILPRVIID